MNTRNKIITEEQRTRNECTDCDGVLALPYSIIIIYNSMIRVKKISLLTIAVS